jgi:glycosyltransferase involved in cell wall biosynthesis
MPPAHPQLYAAIREQRWGDAERLLTRLLDASAPADASLLSAMDHVQAALGNAHRSAHYALRAWRASRPAPALAKRALRTLSEIADWKHAAEAALDAANDSPADAELRVIAAQSCMMAKRFVDAEAVLRPVADDPACPAWIIHEHLSRLFGLGEAHACVERATRALARFPDDAHLSRIIAGALNYTLATPEAIFEAHRRAGALMKPATDLMTPEQLRAARATALGRPGAGTPLRVALLSSEFCVGPVARFTTALVRALTNQLAPATGAASDSAQPARPGASPPGVVLLVYHLGRARDATTAFFHERAHVWRECASPSDADLVRTIRADHPDVLVDLAGFSRGARPAALASRVAPLQVTSVGYPHTTGLATMDLRIADSHTDPPGAEAHATERLVRLDPCFTCFDPTTLATDAASERPRAVDAPRVAPPPAQRAGHVTFASFNSLAKVSRETLDAWASILRELPTSRLLLKNYECQDPRLRDAIRRRFEAHAIPASRVELLAFTDTIDAHLAAYARADVALDTFPYHGTTTTCEALLMGVPVVVRVGRTHASRVGLSILTNVSAARESPQREGVDLRDLITHSAEDYVRAAITLANDAPRRERLRTALRPALIRSPLCNADAYADRWLKAIRTHALGATHAT